MLPLKITKFWRRLTVPTNEEIALKSSRYVGWRVLSFITLGFMVGLCIVSGWFVYLNVFRTLEDANVVFLLATKEDPGTINQEMYERAKIALRDKTTPIIIPEKIRYIFDYRPATSTAAKAPLPLKSVSSRR